MVIMKERRGKGGGQIWVIMVRSRKRGRRRKKRKRKKRRKGRKRKKRRKRRMRRLPGRFSTPIFLRLT